MYICITVTFFVKDTHYCYERSLLLNFADLILHYYSSAEEAGRYLETYKVYENKPPDALLGQSEGDYLSKVLLQLYSKDQIRNISHLQDDAS